MLAMYSACMKVYVYCDMSIEKTFAESDGEA